MAGVAEFTRRPRSEGPPYLHLYQNPRADPLPLPALGFRFLHTLAGGGEFSASAAAEGAQSAVVAEGDALSERQLALDAGLDELHRLGTIRKLLTGLFHEASTGGGVRSGRHNDHG